MEWSESADSATSKCTLAGASGEDAAGVLPADGRKHLAKAFGVVRELALDDPPAFWLFVSLPLKASDSDSLKELAASDSFVSKPRGRLACAGVARTTLVLFPPSADAAPELEDNVIGVADDAPGDEVDAMTREGREGDPRLSQLRLITCG